MSLNAMIAYDFQIVRQNLNLVPPGVLTIDSDIQLKGKETSLSLQICEIINKR
jgi:hypothetical protein